MDLAFNLGISPTFLSDIETGKKWVSAKTLSDIARVLKIEIFELFRPLETADPGISEAVTRHLDDIDSTVIKAIEDAIGPAVRRSLKRVRKYYEVL
jgi:transcriptional regulator with XRE-family HTH domain